MTKDEALDLALAALECFDYPAHDDDVNKIEAAITAIKQARSAPVQEPVAWQLIETAPQDGTKILGWNEEFGARETQMNFYGEGSLGFAAWKSGKGPKEIGWNWSEPKSNWGHTWKPTHWKPLLTPCNTTTPNVATPPAAQPAPVQEKWGASAVMNPDYVAAQKQKAQQALDVMAENARELGLDYEPHKGLSEHLAQVTNGRVRIDPVTGDVGIGTPPAGLVQGPVLQDIEQYRLQMAGISTAAIGYWKEGDGIHPDYDTPALRDVAKLYAKYDALYTAAQRQSAQRQWVGLTNEEVYPLANEHLHYQIEGYEVSGIYDLARAIEAKLKEKNGWYRQHVIDGSPCWCEPETSYTDPETGASVVVHKEPQ